MFTAVLQPNLDILNVVNMRVTNSPRLMQTAVKRNLSRLKSRILRRLQTEPGSPRYPLRWKSQRQRRYVMAKLRRAGNLPYQRTGALAADYDLELDLKSESGVFILTNDNPAFSFVSGAFQQPFHMDTGWLKLEDEIPRFEQEISDVLVQTWITING